MKTLLTIVVVAICGILLLYCTGTASITALRTSNAIFITSICIAMTILILGKKDR